MHEKSHSIQRLAVHLAFEQLVYFKEGEEDKAFEKASSSESSLTAFFKLNSEDYSACQFLYHEIPNHYTFSEKKWNKRKAGPSNDFIGRIYNVSPSEGERYFLR